MCGTKTRTGSSARTSWICSTILTWHVASGACFAPSLLVLFADVTWRTGCAHQALLINLLIIVSLHVAHLVMSESLEWSKEDNHLLFVNVFPLAEVGEAKVRTHT